MCFEFEEARTIGSFSILNCHFVAKINSIRIITNSFACIDTDLASCFTRNFTDIRNLEVGSRNLTFKILGFVKIMELDFLKS